MSAARANRYLIIYEQLLVNASTPFTFTTTLHVFSDEEMMTLEKNKTSRIIYVCVSFSSINVAGTYELKMDEYFKGKYVMLLCYKITLLVCYNIIIF